MFGSGGAAIAAEPPETALGAGLHYNQGDYGTGSTTRILSFVLTGRYDSGPWTFKGTLPYHFISGSGAVVPGLGRVGTGIFSTTSGLGDPVFSATYAAYFDPASQVGLDLTGRVKLALDIEDPDERLSTGEHDFGFQVDAYKTLGRFTVFAGVGYTIFGTSPAFPLDDVFNYTLGASYRLDQRDSVGLSYDERERLTPAAAPQRELTAFWSRRLHTGWRAQLYCLLGLADGSPDFGAGVSVAYAF